MANVEKLTMGSDTYDLRDASAVHTVDSALSSSSTNPVQNKVVYSALKNQPHFEYVMTSGDLQPTNFSGTFPTTFSALVSHTDFKIALRNPVIVHYLSLTGSDDFITQGLLWFGVNTQITDEWTILFPDGVTFQGALTNGVTGTMSYNSSEQVWYLYDVSAHTPGYKTYTDDAIDGLDATISGLGVGKTITALSETNGVISASASNISIDASQVATGTFPTNRLSRPVQLNNGSINGDVTVCGQVDAMRANRLAFLPANHIIVETTTDNGVTWTAGGATTDQKKQTFAGTRGNALILPKIDGVRNINCGLRITFTAMNYNVPDGTAEGDWYQYWNSTYVASAERYTQLREFYMFVNTITDGLSCLVEAATGANPNNWVTLYNSGSGFALTGYSGSDYIKLNSTCTFGGGTNQTGNYWNYRMTFFTRSSTGGTDLSTSSTTTSQGIYQIQGYGPVSWTNPNNMMFKDHLYNWDENKNATFPAALTATGGLRGPGTAYYGTCSTAAATGDKVVDCPGFVLQDGARIAIKFSNGNAASGAIRLNVNNTGLKTIICRGSSSVSYNPVMKFGSADVLEFIYNGSNYILLDGFRIRELATSSSRLTSANMSISGGGLEYFNATSSMTTGKPPGDSHVLGMHWDNGELWTSQLAISNASARIFTRAQNSGTWQPWREAPLFATNPTPGQVVVADTSSFADDCQVKGVTLNVDGANFDGTNPVKHYGITTLYSNGVFSIIDANYNNTLAQGFRMTINVAHDMSYDTGLKMNIRTSGTDVPGSGDKFIKRNGEIIKSLTAGEVLEFVYDGTDWQQVGGSGGDADVAEQLGEEVDVTDNVPYIYRPTGGDVLTGTSKYETLIGGTVAWNQLAALVASSWTKSASVSISITGNTIRLTSTSATSSVKHASLLVVANHVYLSSGTVVSSTTTTSRFGFFDSAGTALKIFDNNTDQTTPKTGSILYKPTASTNVYALRLANAAAANVYADFTNIQLIDLTLALGPTIADYIYSLETATTGAGVKWFRNLFPSDYYPYNTGELLSVMPTAEKSVGFNLFDKSKAVRGSRFDSSGTTSGSSYNRSDWIRITPNTTYYFKDVCGYSEMSAIFWYGANKEYITNNYISGSSPKSGSFTSPVGAYYVGINFPIAYIDSVCINVSDSTKNGTYEPYKESTYPITPVELRGIPKLDSNNKLYYDGDIRNSDGTVTRKYKKVTIDGTTVTVSNFGATSSGYAVFYSASGSISTTARENATLTCDRFTYSYLAYSAMPVMTFCGLSGAASSIWFILPSSVTSLAEANAWFASNPTTLVYELASPTYEEVAVFPNPQVVDPYGVEEFVDERTVAMPVGHESRYVTNLREKLEEAPSVPVDDGRYVVETKNGVSNYVPETVKESEGYFLVTDGESSSDTWHYYKVGKQVTVSGFYTGTSSTATSLSALPFTPKYGLKFILPVMMISPVMMFYFCQVSISANSKTIGTQGHFSDNGSNLIGSWLNIGQIHSTPITFTYITDD